MPEPLKEVNAEDLTKDQITAVVDAIRERIVNNGTDAEKQYGIHSQEVETIIGKTLENIGLICDKYHISSKLVRRHVLIATTATYHLQINLKATIPESLKAQKPTCPTVSIPRISNPH